MDFKGLFLADLHCNKARKDDCLKVLDEAYKIIHKSGDSGYRIPLFICGDFWDSAITATENSGFSYFLDSMADINRLTDVFMIYGTPGHEADKSLVCFEHMGINVFEDNTFKTVSSQGMKFELIALPEPRRSHYVSKITKDTNVNEVINTTLIEFSKSIPKEKKYPRILIGHGEIKGVNMNGDIPCSSPIAFSPSYLKSFNADFLAFGHIHEKQEVFKNCWYIGAAPQKTFGEKHEPSMFLVEIKND